MELDTTPPATPVFLERKRKFVMGHDPGKSSDPTAIAVIEHVEGVLDYRSEYDRHADIVGPPQTRAERFYVRYLERVRLLTDYVAGAHHIKEILAREPLCGNGRDVRPATLVTDMTGVGAAVTDILEAIGLQPVKIVITAGLKVECKGTRLFHVPKAVLISGLDGAIHTDQLQIAPALLEAGAMREELKDLQRWLSAVGKSAYGAREGGSDDLLMAVSYALWWCKRRPQAVPAQFSTYSSTAPQTSFSAWQV